MGRPRHTVLGLVTVKSLQTAGELPAVTKWGGHDRGAEAETPKASRSEMPKVTVKVLCCRYSSNVVGVGALDTHIANI